MAESLLSQKLKKDRRERQAIDQKLADTEIQSTQEEGVLVKEILANVAREFRSQISANGFTDAIIEGIDGYVGRSVSALESSYEQQQRVKRLVMANVTGLGPIQPYMDDPTITEIVVQRFDLICVEKDGVILPVKATFMDDDHLRAIIDRIIQKVGRQLNLFTPMVDARLPDGSRVNATIPPVTPDGATMTIRKFSTKALTGEQYIGLGSVSPQMLLFLKACVEARVSLIVSGGTNSGKTTLLNMLSAYIPEDELIVTIEDSCELQLRQKNVRRMETRQQMAEGMLPVTIQTLVKNSLRMRPDRIIIGEVRDGTVVDLMSAMSTGHEGSMSTIHANSPSNLINARMPILYAMNRDMTFSEDAQMRQIAEALQLIVQVSKCDDGVRRITHISHIAEYRRDTGIILKDVFVYRDGRFVATGYVPDAIIEHFRQKGLDFDISVFSQEGDAHDF